MTWPVQDHKWTLAIELVWLLHQRWLVVRNRLLLLVVQVLLWLWLWLLLWLLLQNGLRHRKLLRIHCGRDWQRPWNWHSFFACDDLFSCDFRCFQRLVFLNVSRGVLAAAPADTRAQAMQGTPCRMDA